MRLNLVDQATLLTASGEVVDCMVKAEIMQPEPSAIEEDVEASDSDIKSDEDSIDMNGVTDDNPVKSNLESIEDAANDNRNPIIVAVGSGVEITGLVGLALYLGRYWFK